MPKWKHSERKNPSDSSIEPGRLLFPTIAWANLVDSNPLIQFGLRGPVHWLAFSYAFVMSTTDHLQLLRASENRVRQGNRFVGIRKTFLSYFISSLFRAFDLGNFSHHILPILQGQHYLNTESLRIFSTLNSCLSESYGRTELIVTA